jgi:hypothetical protein
LKKEYELRTGSFKERGARNALLKLSEEERKVGVIAASAGNHALALAHHGGLLGISVCFNDIITLSTFIRLAFEVGTFCIYMKTSIYRVSIYHEFDLPTYGFFPVST